jgi:hypothetical protein
MWRGQERRAERKHEADEVKQDRGRGREKRRLGKKKGRRNRNRT